MKYHYIRSNVRVKFDSPLKEHARCYLQYKVRFLVLFSKWVTVNKVYYEHGFITGLGKEWDAKEMIRYLKNSGQEYKSIKVIKRQLERDINQNTKGLSPFIYVAKECVDIV